MLGVALAYSVHLINASALAEFGAAVRAVNGEADFALVGPRRGFDEALYGAVATAPGVAVASPIVEVDTLRLRRHRAARARCASSAAMRSSSRAWRRRCCRVRTPAATASSRSTRTRCSSTPAPSERLGGNATTLSLQTASGRRDLRIAGSVAAGGPPLAVIDIAGAQVGARLRRPSEPDRRPPRARRRSRDDDRRAAPAARGARRRRRRSERADLERLARLSRQPHGARPGGDVHRRVPGVLDPRPLGGAAPAAARAARRARPVGAAAARPGAGRVGAASASSAAALGLVLGGALAAVALRLLRRRSRRRLFPGRRAATAHRSRRHVGLRPARRRRRACRRLAAGARGAADRSGAGAEGARHRARPRRAAAPRRRAAARAASLSPRCRRSPACRWPRTRRSPAC